MKKIILTLSLFNLSTITTHASYCYNCTNHINVNSYRYVRGNGYSDLINKKQVQELTDAQRRGDKSPTNTSPTNMSNKKPIPGLPPQSAAYSKKS